MALLPEEIERYAAEHSDPVSPLLEELERETLEKTPHPQMLSGRVEDTFLQMLIKIAGAKRIVEVGTFTGYSALMMAEGLPDDGELTTLEIQQGYADIAQKYFDRNPHGYKIKLVVGPALDNLRTIPDESIDFVFIDADKISYASYYQQSIRILKRGGLVAVDNTLWEGTVLSPDDDDSRAIAFFNDVVKRDDRVEKVMLTVRDGIYLIRKK